MRWGLVVVLLLTASAASGAAAEDIDPRLAGPMMTAARAEVALRDAVIKAMADDAKKREEDWAAYSKPLWEAPAAVSSSQEPPK